MRFHTTIAFSQVRREYNAALQAYRTYDENDPDAERMASVALSRADALFFNVDSYTSHEMQEKVDAAFERSEGIGGIEEYYSKDAMSADFDRVNRLAATPPVSDAFGVWRRAEEQVQEAIVQQADLVEPIERSQSAYRALLKERCTTPGDFIVKQYARLRAECGFHSGASERADMTANLWDICRDEPSHEIENVERHTTYDDINHTDIGMNLLAYGQLSFDAEAWMEAADRVDLRVSLIEQRDGRWMFGIQYQDDAPPRRIERERNRLQRLLNWVGIEDRARLVADEICENWPQLLVHQFGSGQRDVEAA